MIIDNFDLFRQHLTFEKARKMDSKTGKLETINDTYDRYIIHIIKRAKDSNGKIYGVNESNRLIKTFEVVSLEYFDKKRPVIVDLCKSNMARAYILPQVRSTYDCLKELIKIGVDNLENPTVKFQHILRSSLCAMHKSRDKKWILDLDKDNMSEHYIGDIREFIDSNGEKDNVHVWTVDEVLALVHEELEAIGRSKEDAYVVPTKSGHHIVTRPFNLQSAYLKCRLMFEGCKNDKIGWLIKDGMSLLYMETSD